MNPKLRDKLISFGVIGREYKPSIHAGKTLAGHVKDFGDSLRAKGNGQQYAGHVERSIGRIFAGCGFDSLSDIDANRLYTHLADMRGPDGIGERTFNSYLKACRQFARWLVLERRTDSNPIQHLSCITQTEKRCRRRALTLDEQRRLIEATAKGKRHHNTEAAGRAMLYRVALQTGLRVNELRNLTVSSLDIQARTLTLTGAYTKNKKTAVQPLTKPLVADLQAFVSGKLPATKIFIFSRQAAKMIQMDLAAARIEYATDAGTADFHALRHSFVTNLARAGVHPSDAMALARHSTITLTMDFYTHTKRESLQGIIDAQPELKVPKKCPKRA